MHHPTEPSPHIVIVGGVAGGASAAARARRLDERATITLIERGPDISFANCGLPYYVGGEIGDRSKLSVQTPESLRRQLAIEVLTGTEVTEIDRQAKSLTLRKNGSDASETLAYDKLILSPGASPLRPPLPGIDTPGIHTLRNLQDMDRIKAAAEAASAVLVIGAGFIGLEMAEQLMRLGKKVYLIERVDQVLPQLDKEMTYLIEQELRDNGVDLLLGDGIQGFAPSDSGGVTATLESGRTLTADTAILSIGVRPENQLAKAAGLELGERGHIKADSFMRTSDPAIYAIGDACETVDPILGGPAAVPLGGPANRQGRVAADHIVRGDKARPYPGSIGTAIVRVFGAAAGVTGHNEKRLQQLGVNYQKTVISDFNHAGYFPGATHVTVKLLWDAADGRLLGGQVNGYDGVDKRLDVLATAIKGKLSVEDMEHLELAYAPPFGAAKDPVNTAAFSANNIRDGLLRPLYAFPEDDSHQIVDLRPAEVAELKPISGALNIPFPELRSRLGEIDPSKPVVAACALGKTSYFGARLLAQHDFDVVGHVGGSKVAPPDPSGSTAAQPAAQPAPSPANAEPDASADGPAPETVRVDATGLACPGPILKVREAAAALERGQILEVSASDAGFKNDLPAFCKANGYEVLDIAKDGGLVTARLRKPTTCPVASGGDTAVSTRNGATLVVFSGELDKAMAAFVIANGAVAMGGRATLFFTFWGLNVLRKDPAPTVPEKTFMDKMFGWMLPRGANRLPLSQMHMAGMGTRMMKQRMADKDLPNLKGLMEDARRGGVRLVACTMSMEAMGIRESELIDGVELGGVAEFLGAASESGTNLFV